MAAAESRRDRVRLPGGEDLTLLGPGLDPLETRFFAIRVGRNPGVLRMGGEGFLRQTMGSNGIHEPTATDWTPFRQLADRCGLRWIVVISFLRGDGRRALV